MNDETGGASPEEDPLPIKAVHFRGSAGSADIDWDLVEGMTLEDLENLPRPRAYRRLVANGRESLRRRRFGLRMRRQRAVRGWADADWWNLDHHLCGYVGTLLVAMADGVHTYPTDRTYEEWTAELRRRGAALRDVDLDDAASRRQAQEGLHWVADNLGLLWD